MVLGAAAALVVVECGVRLISRVHPSLAIRHPVLGKTHQPDFEGAVFIEEAGRDVFLRFNSTGFRGEDHPRTKAQGEVRIAMLGDSMVAAVEIDEEQTTVKRLEGMLSGKSGQRNVRVMNFGVAGSSTAQELVLYRELVHEFSPDVVVLIYFMGNDFSDNSRRLSSNPRIYFELDEDGDLVPLPFSATRNRLSSWLNRHSRFYVWQKSALKRWRLRNSGRSGSRIHDTGADAELAAAWDLNERLVGQLRDHVVADGARFVLVLCPAGRQVYDDMWAKALREAGSAAARYDRGQPVLRLTGFANRAGIEVIDLTPALRKAATDPGPAAAERLFLAGGEGHLSSTGHAIVAAEIAASLSSVSR